MDPRRLAAAMTTEPSSKEELAFLQERVARFGLFGGALSAGFWLYRVIQAFAVGQPRKLLLEDPSFTLHGVAWVLLVSVWLANRSGTRSRRFIDVTESIGLVGACIAYIAMGYFMSLLLRPEMIVLSALTLALATRAAYVPSTTRRTLGLCVAIGLPYVFTTFMKSLDIPSEILALADPPMTLTEAIIGSTATAAVWWILTTGLCVGITHIVYGLRREVRDVKKLGQYVLEAKLGEGGMGVVYRAQHGMLRRPTAVKLLHPDASSAVALERFSREVRLTARLTHPNTVTIYDYGRTPEGLFYYAMELLDGASLDEIVRVDGPQPAGRVIEILSCVASALTEAHAVGLIHRDIKPGNIILANQGGVPDVAKVVDFGLVKEMERSDDGALTNDDSIAGTPQYIAPEVLTDPDSVDSRADIYALGAVGYFLITGTHLFDGKTLVEICSHHLHTLPEPPAERLGDDVPADLSALLLECLQKDPTERPRTAADLVVRLRSLEHAGTWAEADADVWWEANRQRVLARRGAPEAFAVARTLDIATS